MRARWLVDPDANAVLWRGLSDGPLRLVMGPGQRVGDLGGGNGNFVAPLRAKGVQMISIDVDRDALRDGPRRGVQPVRGSALAIPLRDRSLDAMAGRAVLHHVPDDLDSAFREIHRVVKPGGLVLFQEPTSGNLLANIARKRLPTERHDPHERPLPFDAYVEAMRRHFVLLDVEPNFLLSYLMPHVVSRVHEDRRRVPRRLTRVLYAWDRHLLRALPGLRERAAYVSILARRPDGGTHSPSG